MTHTTYQAILELTPANDLGKLADRESLAAFAPWAEQMARNLSARERASVLTCECCDEPADGDSDLCRACEAGEYEDNYIERLNDIAESNAIRELEGERW